MTRAPHTVSHLPKPNSLARPPDQASPEPLDFKQHPDAPGPGVRNLEFSSHAFMLGPHLLDSLSKANPLQRKRSAVDPVDLSDGCRTPNAYPHGHPLQSRNPSADQAGSDQLGQGGDSSSNANVHHVSLEPPSHVIPLFQRRPDRSSQSRPQVCHFE